MINRLRYNSPKGRAAKDIGGWLIHYSVGAGFLIAYDQIWKRPHANEKFGNSLLLGLISGGIGASVWDAVLRLHPDPPQTPIKRFMMHLLLAHVIFAVTAKAGYRMAEVTTNHLDDEHFQMDPAISKF